MHDILLSKWHPIIQITKGNITSLKENYEFIVGNNTKTEKSIIP